MVKSACRDDDEKELRVMMEGKSKMVRLQVERVGLKPYILSKDLSGVRLIFKERTRMLKCAGNFPNMPKYLGTGAVCRCGESDSQSHLMNCRMFSHLRGGEVDLGNNGDLVTYLREVMKLRESREKEK